MDQSSILNVARQHYSNKEYGKSCSYYLYLFNVDQSFCRIVKEEFIFAVHNWIKILINLNKMADVFSFIHTSLEICQPIKVDILLASSQEFYTSGFVFESAKLLAPCRENRITNYGLEENIEHLYNMLIDRWHFRMLNDKNRNLAYHAGITEAYNNGHKRILDIGSGSGIFSLLAFRLGFETIYSCEASVVMCDIQRKCISANNALQGIRLINKFSNEINVEEDLTDKPTLIVTEIFDCGLLGEGVLPVLIHAWENLLDIDRGEIIPRSAVVYGVCIECNEIRKHCRYITSNGYTLLGCKDPGDEKQQPYTTEYMAGIKGGYQELSKPFILKSFNFNCVSELKQLIGKTERLKIPITTKGRLDAIMVYFTLDVHSSFEINTLDKNGLCWEQAIYNVPSEKFVHPGDGIDLDVGCGEEHLDIKLVDILNKNEISPAKKMKNDIPNDISNVPNDAPNNTPNDVPNDAPKDALNGAANDVPSRIFPIDRRLVSRMNDELYNEKYKSIVLSLLENWKVQNGSKQLNICFLCCEMSILPLLLVPYDFTTVFLIQPLENIRDLLETEFPESRLKYLSRSEHNDSTSEDVIFDIVISEPIDCDGLIMENYIEDMSMIKRLYCSNDTVHVPSEIKVSACLISSERLLCENRILKENIPLNLDIEGHVNEYFVYNHPDVNGCNITNRLSDDYLLLRLDLSQNLLQENEDIFHFQQNTVSINITKCGMLTGLMYWFDIKLHGEEYIFTGQSENTHWHQVCVIRPNQTVVNEKERITLLVTRNRSNLHFQIC